MITTVNISERSDIGRRMPYCITPAIHRKLTTQCYVKKYRSSILRIPQRSRAFASVREIVDSSSSLVWQLFLRSIIACLFPHRIINAIKSQTRLRDPSGQRVTRPMVKIRERYARDQVLSMHLFCLSRKIQFVVVVVVVVVVEPWRKTNFVSAFGASISGEH